MKSVLVAAAAAVLFTLSFASPGLAQQAPVAGAPTSSAALRLLAVIPAKHGKTLKVSSPAFQSGGAIPLANTQYGANLFPGLAWSRGPAGVKSYVVVIQDTDVLRQGAPLVHWVLFNVPATTRTVDAGATTPPDGALYGFNVKGAQRPYLGPRPPPGPAHNYDFQVFALDLDLPVEAGDNLSALTAAMTGHVLASGEIVGAAQAPAPINP